MAGNPVWSKYSSARYLIHDRDGKYAQSFDQILKAVGIGIVKLPPQSPNAASFTGIAADEFLDHTGSGVCGACGKGAETKGNVRVS